MDINFIHLRASSSYSMLESAVKVDDLTRLAKENNMPAVALTDKGNMFGALEFSLSAAKNQLQPINGVVLNLEFSNNGKQDFAEILLLAKDTQGYKNILALSSYVFTKNDRKICNHINFLDLKKHSSGLIALSSYHQGIIGKSIESQNFAQAQDLSQSLKNIFGDRIYFEIMRHSDLRERKIETDYINLALEQDIPIVATNNILFSEHRLHEMHDVLLCISQGVTMEHQNRKRASNQCYFKSQEEMAKLFSDLPSAIKNTVHIARRCHVAARDSKPMLPSFIDENNPNLTEEEILRGETKKGLEEKLKVKFAVENLSADEQKQVKSDYFKRLEYELGIICRMNFAGYFLIVSDFIKWSKSKGIAVGPGRGSGAGSMVAWSLLITDLDPIKFGLIFERFLNPERISMPDFDIDFCQKRREEVIEYVREKYGSDRVGQIITFGKMQAKAVIKDVARVLSLPYRLADQLTELVPFNAINPVTLSQAIGEVPELAQAAKGEGLFNSDEQKELIKQVLDTALVLEGLHRHASIHAAGIVISSHKLMDILPLYQDMDSQMLIIQYSMKYAELAGLMKFDFLGLQTLTIINSCLELLKEQNIHIDNFTSSNYDDPVTYKMLSTGNSTGVFQFESVGMKDTLRRLKPDSVGDLIALGALYRPGPMENIPTYIACKHKKQQPNYLHPLLEETLRETYGVIIYQEQVMEIARILGGYSMGKADLLRRAMGKKNKAQMQEQEAEFIKGAIANNIQETQAKEIFSIVAKFAGYGFNKAHASAYGIISYQTAYLKANFPVEFLVVCMNLDIDNNDKINLFLQEARILNIKIMRPDVNKSYGKFTINTNERDGKYIQYGLGAIKGVTINFGDIVAQEREKNGNFKDILNFVERIEPKFLNRRLVENLIYAGGFDMLHDNRGQLLASIYPGSYQEWLDSVTKGNNEVEISKNKKTISTAKLLSYANSFHKEKNSGQYSLLKISSSDAKVLEPSAHKITDQEKALQEFTVLGCFLRYHPLIAYREFINQKKIPNSKNLYESLPEGSSFIEIAGFIQKKDARMSARGKFITLQLSDEHGIFDITIFSDDVLQKYSQFIALKNMVMVGCDAYKDKGGLRLTAQTFKKCTDLLCNEDNEIELYCSSENQVQEIVAFLENKKAPDQEYESSQKVKISFPVKDNYFVTEIELKQNFLLDSDDLQILTKWKKL